MPGFAPTQGHIPSGVPFIGHAVDAITAGSLKRAMIIGKGSLFLARLTNLADGASFLLEGPSAVSGAADLSKEDIKAAILDVLAELAGEMSKKESAS